MCRHAAHAVGLMPATQVCWSGRTSAVGSYRTRGGTFSRFDALDEIDPVVGDGVDDQSRREAAGLDARGVDPRAVCARNVRLPASSVEPVHGLSLDQLVTRFNDRYLEGGRPAPRHQLHRTTLQLERTSLPVRLPGQHLHPQLRRSSWDGPPRGRAASSA